MENKKRVFTVLVIDGGGVRGIIPARILQEIEERTGKPVSALFDMIGGNSTGGIIGGSLVIPDAKDLKKPRFSAKDVLNFYYTLSEKVFPEMRFKSILKISNGVLYDAKPLDDALLENCGDLKMKDALTSFMVPATDIKNFRPVWISYIKGQKDTSKEGWSSMRIRDAIRATATAPTYLPSKYLETTPNENMPNVKHRHALIDGAFFAGNTMQHLLIQAGKVAPPDAEIILVHIGTGDVMHSISPEEFNALSPLAFVRKANGSLLFSLITDMPVIDVKNDMRDELGDRFFTFDGLIDPKDPNAPGMSLDDARMDNLKRLEKFAEKIISTKSAELDRLCTILKSRELIEQRHLESQSAMQKLTDMLAATNTVRGLMRLYFKIVRFSSDIESTRTWPGDAEIKELSQKLTEHHKAEIDRIYRVLLDKKQHQSKILNTIKEAGEDLTEIGKKIFVDPFKSNDPPPPAPPANNNQPPSPPAEDAPPPKRNDGPKI